MGPRTHARPGGARSRGRRARARAAVLAAWFGWAGAGAAAAPPGDLVPDGVLRVAVPERAEPPFLAYGADGQPDGYDPAVARLLAAALGAQAVLVPTPDGRAGVLATVRSGRAQLGLARLSLDRKAARQVAFSRPYAAPPRAVLYPRLRLARAIPGAPPERLLERPGTVVAVVREDLAGAYLAEAFPDARALVLDGLAAAAAALRTGQAQLLLSDRPRLLGWLAQHPGLALELGYRELPGTRDAVVIALGWDAQRLAGWLDTALEVLEADGTLPALRRRHLEPAAGGSP